MIINKLIKASLIIFSVFFMFCNLGCVKQPKPIAGLGLTEQNVIDSWIYVLGRYLVIRQEHIDIAEEGVDYNVIKYNELGKAEFVNPNLDVVYTALGDLYTATGRYDKAEEAYLEALRIDPTSAVSLMGLGEVFRLQQRPE